MEYIWVTTHSLGITALYSAGLRIGKVCICHIRYIYIYNIILIHKEQHKSINTVFPDLSKAFDTLDHNILNNINTELEVTHLN